MADVNNSRDRFLWKVTRVGGVLRSLLLSLCGATLLIGAAVVLEPSSIVAMNQRFDPPKPGHDPQRTRDEFAQTLAGIVSNCVEVLAVNPQTQTSQASIVLWVSDQDNPGVIDPREVAVISHSQLLRTITVYSVEPERSSGDKAANEDDKSHASAEPAATRPSVWGAPRTAKAPAVRLSGPLDREAVTAPVFCERWRNTPSVQSKTIATGISDMRIDPAGGKDGDLSLLRLRLRWSPDSADGAGEASAWVSAGTHRE